MHPNLTYRTTSTEKNIEFARERCFGALTVNADPVPLISHIPFFLSEDGTYLEAHLVRSNPIIHLLKQPIEAVMVISGGDAYISPDWYGVEEQVPTWNYVAVHVRGTLKRLEDQALRGILDRLSEQLEDRLAPKRPWKIDKVDNDIYAKMARQILPIAMDVNDIQGTWKLAQNKPSEARKGAVKGVEAARLGLGADRIAKLMAQVKDD